jgi:thioesterase domain-containing protein/acyl carrier protein
MDSRKEAWELDAALANFPIVGEDPEALFTLGARYGYDVRACWTPGTPDGRFDAVFVESGCEKNAAPPPHGHLLASQRSWRHHANDPVAVISKQRLGSQLRDFIGTQLPDYMMPAAFVVLDNFPRTPNGKLDRKRLPTPDGRPEIGNYVEPRTLTEEILVTNWREVLKLDRVGVEDNFFELGGHSLLAVKLVNLLSQTGIEITIEDLLRHATIASLAKYVAQRKDQASRQDIVPIRVTGTERPLFLIHEIHGIDYYFAWLAPHIDSNVPVYGLPAIPVDATQLRTVEGIASRMIAIIRSIQPVGPYRVAGWSFGGVVAFEIAAQLIGQDQLVEFVGLLDSYSPTLVRDIRGDRHRHNHFYDHLIDFCQSILALVEEVNRQNDQTRLAQHQFDPEMIRQIIRALEEKSEEFDFDDFVSTCRDARLLPWFLGDSETTEIQQHVARVASHYEALENYLVSPIPIPVHLFAAADQALVFEARPHLADPLLGWGSVLPADQIRLVSVPGNHQSMVGAHVKALGQAITKALSEPRRRMLDTDYRPLSTLRTGREDRAPVFCIPSGGDSAARFVDFASALDDGWTLHGLQARGLHDLRVPHTTVEAASAVYMQAIDATWPDGGVHLLGHSFGGWIAFEIAIRLQAEGRPAASLTLIDSRAPGGDRQPNREYTATEVIKEFVESLELAARRSLDIQTDTLDANDPAGQLQLLHERMVGACLIPRGSDPGALAGSVRTFGAALRTNYRPQRPFSSPVRLLLADDPSLDEFGNQREHLEMLAGWTRWAAHLTSWRGPGDRFTIMSPPHVQVLADWWRDGLSMLGDAERSVRVG